MSIISQLKRYILKKKMKYSEHTVANDCPIYQLKTALILCSWNHQVRNFGKAPWGELSLLHSVRSLRWENLKDGCDLIPRGWTHQKSCSPTCRVPRGTQKTRNPTCGLSTWLVSSLSSGFRVVKILTQWPRAPRVSVLASTVKMEITFPHLASEFTMSLLQHPMGYKWACKIQQES